jgi:asparagine synthase (glutamine-hydrolysing)
MPGFTEQDAKRIEKKLTHRGPNDRGYLQGKNFGMGFRRLSILDLSTNGHQPMTLPGKHCHLTFNGEIYNYRDLINHIPQNTLSLRGHSDTEILLHLISQKKEAALPLLNGMFAFAYVDEDQGTFIIARDRFGVKPLFYSCFGKTIIFASELPALLEFGVSKKINKLALNKYIRVGNIAAPDTIFEGIYKLEPGHYIKGSLNVPDKYLKKSWWTPPLEEETNKSEAAWLEEIDHLLLDATRIRLISDVPVGLFLSGGLDSSLVAYYASKQTEFTKPKALSVIFDEKEYNEFEIAKTVAEHNGLELVTIKVNKGNLDEIRKINSNIGEPFSDSSLTNQYYLSKEARRHAIVFLTGDGGDEAFAGYSEYIKTYQYQDKIGWMSAIAKIGFSPLQWIFRDDTNLKQQLAKLSIGPTYLGAGIRMNFMEPILTKLLSEQFALTTKEITQQIRHSWDKTQGLPLVKRMQLFDYKHYLEPDVLAKVDRATMAHSIEARSPFLDYRVVELALQIPNAYNIKGGKGKQLLRRLAEKHLPPVVVQAPKKGFGLPYREWIDESLKNRVSNLNKRNDHQIWNRKTFQMIVEKADTPRYDMYSIFWRVWMFEEWYDMTYNK